MAEEGFEMLFSKFRQRREEEQKEYDDIIQQAQQRDLLGAVRFLCQKLLALAFLPPLIKCF